MLKKYEIHKAKRRCKGSKPRNCRKAKWAALPAESPNLRVSLALRGEAEPREPIKDPIPSLDLNNPQRLGQRSKALRTLRQHTDGECSDILTEVG